jgi:hypothetical protein
MATSSRAEVPEMREVKVRSRVAVVVMLGQGAEFIESQDGPVLCAISTPPVMTNGTGTTVMSFVAATTETVAGLLVAPAVGE